MKKLYLLILIFITSFIFVFSGCSVTKIQPKQYSTPLYTINISGNECSLATDHSNSSSQFQNGMHTIWHPSFSSLSEMRQAIITGSITDDELEGILVTSPKNSDGSIKICNVDQLYNCMIPSDCETRSIVWTGNEYTFMVTNGTVHGSISCGDSNRFFDILDEDHLNYSAHHTVTLTAQETILDRSATVFYYTTTTTKLKDICYEIQTGNKSIIVREEYLLEADDSQTEASPTIPQSVSLWIMEDSGYAYGWFHSFEERPSVEWLSQFGLQEYVEASIS